MTARLVAALRQRLGWKLFLSYVIIVFVGLMVLAGTASLQAPTALSRHMVQMQAVLGDDPAMIADLRAGFRAAVNEILIVAAFAAFGAAAAVSLFTARRIVGPIEDMMRASRKIAMGDYLQRVQVSGDDELAALAKAFNQMAQTLGQVEQRRMVLIGDVAHELRTPLTNIRGVMEGLVDGVLLASPETYLRVQAEVSRLQRLVDDLAELSRAEAGEFPLDIVEVDVVALADEVAERLRPQFDDKSVSLDVDLPDDLPRVLADPLRVTQVLLNLLGNALQYTPIGGMVTISAHRKGEALAVVVRDNGVGISADALQQVFERFYRVDKSRSRAGGGSGLGLTIARYVVEAQGSRIHAESSGVGQGSTFLFTLPVVA